MKKEDVKKGDFVRYSDVRLLTDKQKNTAMHVMETYDEVMTVKKIGGCFTAPYSYFEKVDDIKQFKNVAFALDLDIK